MYSGYADELVHLMKEAKMPTDDERFSEMLTGQVIIAMNVPRVTLDALLTDDSQLQFRRLPDGTSVLEDLPSPKGNLAAQAKKLIREIDWANPYRPRIIFTDGGSREFPLSGDPGAVVK